MEINFLELLTLYSFFIPSILFYTLPISIFIGIAISLSKLSTEYELIVITSFGFKPTQTIKLILPILLISTVLLLINSLILIPKANHLYDAFKAKKKQEAQFNIKASEYGQSFGNWLIYVDKEKDRLYEDIVLFQPNNMIDTFIIAKTATLNNDGLSLSLELQNGKALKIEKNINQINFEKMIISDQLKESTNINTLSDILLYWSDIDKNQFKLYKFNFAILMSLFPILSLLFYISLGFYNPRYEKNKATIYSIVLTIGYVVIAQKLSNKYGFIALYTIPLVWVFLSYLFYIKKVKHSY